MKQQKRNRPRISTTLSPYTIAVLVQVSKDQGFERMGQTVDYIIHDWVGFKRAAIAAHPQTTELNDALHHSSLEITETYAEALPA